VSAKAPQPAQADTAASENVRTISIRWIVTLAAIALLLVSMVGVGLIGERHTRKVLTSEIEARISVMARNLAALGSSALFADYPELTLHPIMRRMQDQHPELALVVVVDHENRIKGHVDARVIGSEFVAPVNLRPRETLVECGPTESMLENTTLLVAEAGITHATGGTLGKAFVAIPKSYIETAVTQARVQQLIVISAILLVGIALAMILMSVLLRPIGVLLDGIKRIGRGDLDNPIDLRDRTEFGLLAKHLNSMVQELKSVHLRGSLECFPPATLFQMMALGQFDGRLTLRVRDGVCLVYFQGGRIVFARGLTNTRLGEELVNRGRIDPAARDAALKEWKRQRGTKRLGTIFVESGLISRQELEEHVQDRIKDSVYEIMKWNEGRFNFENGVMPADEDILLDDNVESLLLQCMTRLDHAELERAETAKV
jgi:HAMP domain-containing protein